MLHANTEYIRTDLGSVFANRQQDIHRSQIEDYFARQVKNTQVTPLANAAGELYLHELAEFMTTLLLPADGSWAQAIYPAELSQVDIQKSEQMLNYLRRSLAMSNFYPRAQALIVQALLYNEGIMTVNYHNGLTYDTHDCKDVASTDEADEYLNRSYSKRNISVLELVSDYTDESVPEKYKVDLQKQATSTVEIVTAILPNKEPFFMGSESKYKFLKKEFLSDGELIELEPKDGAAVGYNHFPLCRFNTGQVLSMARKGLSDAVAVNSYEQMFLDRGELVTYPPMALPSTLAIRGAYDLGPRGSVPLEGSEKAPEPINTTASLQVSEATIAKKEQRLREIFKIDLIRRVQISSVSQFEYNQNLFNALRTIQPMATNLLYRTITQLMKRTHKLLMDNDKTYKKLAVGVDRLVLDDISFDHIGRLMQKASTLANLGRFGQAAQFYLQVDPEAAALVDVDKALEVGANTMGIPEILRSREEAQEIMKAKAQAVQQQQAVEQQSALQGGTDGQGNTGQQGGGQQGGQ